ncbi:hypothetical protein FOXG_11701 [Fusarium oxysporum f. sp. lycopersici 4287]|uniref:Uncharacterized protein n=2 Tax=Fusarium oxysporum TaxID=5507 RepID=A0A0J9VMW4_FUSO4|nr:hypothetical protein FOXG_11701 [Fusarium oxysporum f. sp. lycopersici 4287]EXK29785.1 hypothetical protein FOMG_14215 [Fusarium oxysporum f. sp. melonis 26406]KNB12015.1 hypothetical protein FOXG_11701 [Fusarium oxysporum f. sp. lycopersici 4287]
MRCCHSAIYTVMMRGLEIVVQRYHFDPAMVQHDVGQHHFIVRYGRDDDTRNESWSYMKLPLPALHCLFRFNLNTKRLTQDYTIQQNKNIMSERRRSSGPKAPTGLNDETAEEVHDIIHQAEMEEQKMHGKDALCQDDVGPSEGGEQKQQSAMGKVKEALNLGK